MRPGIYIASTLAFALIGGCTCAAAQTTPLPTPAASPLSLSAAPAPTLAGIAHVAMRVHDLDASVAFYQKLGFVRSFALSRDGKVYEAFIKINDRQFIELYPVSEKTPQVGFLHLCYEGDDLNSVHDFYVSEGLHPISVRTAGAGNLLFTMPGPMTPTGPENLEYTQYMPGSLHSKDFGKDLGSERIGKKLVRVTIATQDPDAARAFYVNMLRFVPETPGSNHLTLPGNDTESVEIVPAQPLGFRASIGFEANLPEAVSALRARDIAFTRYGDASHPALKLTDPDGNEILFYPPPPPSEGR
jgi:catechol 2,3-dioxygenase-like lactoylglutathione lyase family enzyme